MKESGCCVYYEAKIVYVIILLIQPFGNPFVSIFVVFYGEGFDGCKSLITER